MKGMMRGVGAAMALLAAGTASGVEAQDASFRWQNAMSPGQVLEVRGIVGQIRAEYTSGSQAELVAEKDGRAGDFDEVEIRVVKEPNGYTVCAVYHAHDNPGDDCDNRGDRSRWGSRHSIDVGVNYVVKVPAGVEFHGNLVSGDIRADGLRSQVRANTVGGDIYVSTTERAWGNTVSGSIEIEMGSSDWTDLEFQTVSGDITLWLPAGIETDVDFESLSGDIDSDFDLTLTGRQRRRWIGANVEGYIGDRGERSLTFNTVSGDVRLRRSR
ncbi:MAG TPA: DUF4097 family beta strand repeat-containing protein [Longimicrobiales bacterium]|nr:DUF4097 family beta strand repeat-containing protein [Longimicrobiales bacterium]